MQIEQLEHQECSQTAETMRGNRLGSVRVSFRSERWRAGFSGEIHQEDGENRTILCRSNELTRGFGVVTLFPFELK